MDSATLVALFGTFASVLTAGYATYRAVRKEDRSADNEELSIQIQSWRNIVADLGQQVKNQKAEISELRVEVKQCHTDRDELIFKIHGLERAILNLGRKRDEQ